MTKKEKQELLDKVLKVIDETENLDKLSGLWTAYYIIKNGHAPKY
jgi:hypothetical protein